VLECDAGEVEEEEYVTISGDGDGISAAVMDIPLTARVVLAGEIAGYSGRFPVYTTR
jgi:hypothetical protein